PSVNFANQLINTTSAATPVALKNTGSADLVITSLAVAGANASEFAFTSATLPITVTPKASTTVNVTFAPTATGSRSASLSITDNVSGSPQVISLSGVGTSPAIEITPVTVTFADQLVGSSSAAKNVTIKNTGTADLVVSSITLGGAASADFTMSAP